jgi:hypothetical protein
MSIYRKSGAVVRWENGTIVRVLERGVAIEHEDRFECRPDDAAPATPPVDLRESVESVRSAAKGIRAVVPPSVDIERLLLIEGVAAHEFEGVRWSDRTRRVHIALTRGAMRVLVDLGSFDADEIARAADALARAGASEIEAPPRLRLAPSVTAALLPSLVGIAPPNVRLLQTAGGVDGKGQEIVEARDHWPNWYRPSYRIRPVRAPLNLRLECDVTTIDPERPVALALLAPVDGLVARVLVDDRGEVHPSTVRLTRIDAVGPGAVWYPYGAGSFGAEMML